MPYVGQDFTPPRDPTETVLFGFDFAPWLGAGETLATSTWSCAVISGTDPTPSSHIVGSSAIVGTISQQLVGLLLVNCRYRLTATVTTSAGETLALWSHIACFTPQ